MDKDEVKDFFATMGEIWRDICAIEFLMRCALAQKSGDINFMPTPPFLKGNKYYKYPKSFESPSFENIACKFTKKFPHISIPQEIIDLRNAMAHGLIAKIDNNETEELIKFKKQDDGSLMVEFSIILEKNRINQIKQSLSEIRRWIALEAADKPKK